MFKVEGETNPKSPDKKEKMWTPARSVIIKKVRFHLLANTLQLFPLYIKMDNLKGKTFLREIFFANQWLEKCGKEFRKFNLNLTVEGIYRGRNFREYWS